MDGAPKGGLEARLFFFLEAGGNAAARAPMGRGAPPRGADARLPPAPSARAGRTARQSFQLPKPMKHRAARLSATLIFALGTHTLAQDTPAAGAPVPQSGPTLPATPPRITPPSGAPMQTILYEAELLARDLGPARRAQLRQALDRRMIAMDADGLVHVEIVGPIGAEPVTAERMAESGARLQGTWRHRADVFAPVERLSELALRLPEGHFMSRAHVASPDQTGGEGATVIGSDTYVAQGADGSGRTVGIIDSGFLSLASSQTSGDAPAGYYAHYYSGLSFFGSNIHGTACTEALFDHAPGATYWLFRISGITQLGQAVEDAIANGVNVISHSMSNYNQGWADNSGDACAIANEAADAGILFFTSAGNRALQHWRGPFSGDANNWHRWSGTDITNTIPISPGASGSFYLQWDTSAGAANYDLYLYNSQGTIVLASSTNSGQNFEEFSYTNNSSSTTAFVQFAVQRVSGASTSLQVFMHGSNLSDTFEYHMSEGSITSPSNSTRANVISVGAVPWDEYAVGNGATGLVTEYSSRGPSNGGLIRPRLIGPTNTGTHVGGAFSGTSCSTPNAAGAATVFWSSTAFSAVSVRSVLNTKAGLWKDWGAAGNDSVYGNGGIVLAPHAWGTVWLSSDFGNVFNVATAPYFTFSAAWNNVPSGGRIATLLGGTYSATELGSKNVTVEAFGGEVTLTP